MTEEKIMIEKKNNSVHLKVNPKIYPLEVVYSAAYMFLDRAYVIIDGDPQKEILIQLKSKKDDDLERMALEFNNELVSYAVYVVQAARTSEIRAAIVKKALEVVDKVDQEPIEEACEECADEDPLGISKPWTPDSAKGLKIPEDLDEDNK